MTGLQIAYLVILSVCVLASGFFSGSETALIGIQRERVAQLVESDRRGRFVDSLLRDPDAMLSTLLLANNFVNILAASIATVSWMVCHGLGSPGKRHSSSGWRLSASAGINPARFPERSCSSRRLPSPND